MEHKARKSKGANRKPSEAAAAAPSSSRSKPTEDIEADAVEQITLDDMFVIDSAGEYSVSGDETPAAADTRTSKRDASDARRRKDFQLFLSYLRNIDCNYCEVTVSTHTRHFTLSPTKQPSHTFCHDILYLRTDGKV